MLNRLLSVAGFVAHIGDAIIGPFRLSRPRTQLVAGTARVPGALLIGVVLGVCAVASFTGATYADANKEPTTYTIEQLTSGADRGGKDYATVTGTLYDYYVDETFNGKYQYTYYLLGDRTNDGTKWIVVRSGMSETQMEELVSADGTVTLTGMVASDSDAVDSALRTLGTRSPDGVDPARVLREGDRPLQAGTLYTIAGLCGLIGLLLLGCWLATLSVGYVVFRPAANRHSLVSPPGSGFLPVRVTGLISGYANGRRARELRAQLHVPQANPAAGAQPMDLVWQTMRSGWAGVRLTPGVASEGMGTAYPVTGARPAIKARFGKFDIILSFDNELARDAAFDQFRASAGLIASPDGASASAPYTPPTLGASQVGAGPTAPAGPTGWMTPAASTGWAAPAGPGPTAPVGPGPTAPAGPTGWMTPASPTDPTGTPRPATPTDPTGPVGPVGPVGPDPGARMGPR
jgi:hypothetical protein